METDGSSKTSAGAVAAALPDDLLVEILRRVPAKSICRFKCVSKAWRDLIADPDHRKKLRHAMQGLFLVMTPEPRRYDSFSFMDLRAAGSVPLDDDVGPGFSLMLDQYSERCNLIFTDSCNGLILYGCDQPPYDMVVCNTTTKQWRHVPCASPGHTFLAFDPAVSSHFHLIQFRISDQNGLSLEALRAYSSETETWSHNQIDSQSQQEEGILAGWHHHVTLSYAHPRRAFVNGFLHLIVQDLNRTRIVAVDVQGKARRMIEVPGMADDGGHLCCYLEQSQGCLHYMTKEIPHAPPEDNYKLSIWVLQDYDTQEWVLKNTVSYLEVFGGLTGHILDFISVELVDIHQDRNMVFLFHRGSGELIAYDMDHKEVSAIATVEQQKTPFGFARYIPCFSEFPALTG